MNRSIIFFLVIFLCPAMHFAQEGDSVHVKILQNRNGEMEVFEKSYPNQKAMENDPEFKKFRSSDGDSSTWVFRSGENFNWNGDENAFVIIEKSKNGNKKFEDNVIRLRSGNGRNFIFRDDEDDSNMIIIEDDSSGTFNIRRPRNRVWVSDGHGSRFRGPGSMKIQDISGSDLEGTGKSMGRDLKVSSIEFNINATKKTLYVQFETSPGELTVEIFDPKGSQLFYEHKSDFDGHYAKTLNLSGQGAGTYFLEIRQGARVLYKRILIE